MKYVQSGLLLLIAVFCAEANAQLKSTLVSATPQRPSSSTSTATTHPGWLEVEFGSTFDAHVLDSPVVLKLGIRRNLELFFGISPFVRASNGVSATGFGDTIVGSRSRFSDGDKRAPSFAGQITVKLPTGDEDKGLGSGQTEWTVLLILSQSSPGYSLDANVGLQTLMASGDTESRFLGIGTVAKSFSPKLSAYAEMLVSHSVGRTAGSAYGVEDVSLNGAAGLSFSLSPRFVLDSGVNINISNSPYDFQLLVGATWSLFKIW